MKGISIRQVILVWMLFEVSLVSCSTTATTEPDVSPINSIALDASQPAVLTSTPQASSTQRPTNTLGVTSTPEVDIRLSKKCITTATSLVSAPLGTIVLKSDQERLGDLLLLDLKTNQTLNVGQMRSWSGHVGISPDHNQLAFIAMNDQLLRVVNADGAVLRSIPVPESWQSIIQWIQEDKILIENVQYIGLSQIYSHASSILFSLQTGEQQEYLPDYPEMNIVDPQSWWGSYSISLAVYNPSFSHVVYEGQIGTDGLLFLWDLEDQRKIAQWYIGEPDYQGVPVWTRDGNYFVAGLYPTVERWDGKVFRNVFHDLAYIGGYDLFKISRDGELERLTYLTTEYKAAEEGRSLSPDERFVTFWLNLDFSFRDQEATRQLAILDMQTGEITNLCLAGGDYPWPPVWSPDGKHLIVTISDSRNRVSDVFLVDLENELSIKIADHAIGIGWMVSENP